jgi:hypothetical protein
LYKRQENGATENLEGSSFFSFLGGVRPCLSVTEACYGTLVHAEDYKVKVGPIHSKKAYRTSRGSLHSSINCTSVGAECFNGIIIS